MELLDRGIVVIITDDSAVMVITLNECVPVEACFIAIQLIVDVEVLDVRIAIVKPICDLLDMMSQRCTGATEFEKRKDTNPL